MTTYTSCFDGITLTFVKWSKKRHLHQKILKSQIHLWEREKKSLHWPYDNKATTIAQRTVAISSMVHFFLACFRERCLLICSFLFPKWVQHSTAYHFSHLPIDPLWFILLNDYIYKLLTFNYSTSYYLDTKWKLPFVAMQLRMHNFKRTKSVVASSCCTFCDFIMSRVPSK